MKELIIMVALEAVSEYSMLPDALKLMLPLAFILSALTSYGFYDKANLFCIAVLIVYVGCELMWLVLRTTSGQSGPIVVFGVIALFALVGAVCGMIVYKLRNKNRR